MVGAGALFLILALKNENKPQLDGGGFGYGFGGLGNDGASIDSKKSNTTNNISNSGSGTNLGFDSSASGLYILSDSTAKELATRTSNTQVKKILNSGDTILAQNTGNSNVGFYTTPENAIKQGLPTTNSNKDNRDKTKKEEQIKDGKNKVFEHYYNGKKL